MDITDPRQALGLRLKAARELLQLSQGDAADRSGLSQRDVSQLEKGVKRFVPTEYIQFLHSTGIDLNSVFAKVGDVQKRAALKGEKIMEPTPSPKYREAQVVLRELEDLKSRVELLLAKGKRG